MNSSIIIGKCIGNDYTIRLYLDLMLPHKSNFNHKMREVITIRLHLI